METEQKQAIAQQLAIAERIKDLRYERGELFVSLSPHLQKLSYLDGAIAELTQLLEGMQKAGE